MLRNRFKYSRILVLSGVLAAVALPATAQAPFPEAPRYRVYDGPDLLDERTQHSLEVLLAEHYLATAEGIYIAVFDGVEGSILESARKLFAHWGLNRTLNKNSVLLVADWKKRKAVLLPGVGLESLLTTEKIEKIVDRTLEPGLKASHADRAIQAASFEILESLESPLIASGQALSILEQGGYDPKWVAPEERAPQGWSLLLLAGVLLSGLALYLTITTGAHYTAEGWVRDRARLEPRTWLARMKARRRTGQGSFTGGGTVGSW